MDDSKAVFLLLASFASLFCMSFDMRPIIVDVLGVIKNNWSYPEKTHPRNLTSGGEFNLENEFEAFWKLDIYI